MTLTVFTRSVAFVLSGKAWLTVFKRSVAFVLSSKARLWQYLPVVWHLFCPVRHDSGQAIPRLRVFTLKYGVEEVELDSECIQWVLYQQAVPHVTCLFHAPKKQLYHIHLNSAGLCGCWLTLSSPKQNISYHIILNSAVVAKRLCVKRQPQSLNECNNLLIYSICGCCLPFQCGDTF